MRYKYFMIRMANLLLILLLLAGYQISIYAKNQEIKVKNLENQVSAMKKEREELEKEMTKKAGIANEKKKEQQDTGWKDGTYQGSGDGFGGKIEVAVTIKNKKITDIKILQADGEDSAYLSKAKDMIPGIKKAQSTDIDTISGATFSSTGIKNAVQEALERAGQ